MQQEQPQQMQIKKTSAKGVLYTLLGITGVSLCIGVGLAVWAVTSGSAPKSLEQENVVKVSGTGKVKKKPNEAVINLNLSKEADTAQDAQQQLSLATEQLKASIRQFGITDEQIETANYSIYETIVPDVYEDEPVIYQIPEPVEVQIEGQIEGQTAPSEIAIAPRPPSREKKVWRASHDIRIQVINQPDVGTTANQIAQAVTATPDVEFRNINFQLKEDDKKQVDKLTQEEAVNEAKEKAEHLASASDRKLGKVLAINESPTSDPLIGGLYAEATAGLARDEEAPLPGIQPEEIEFTSTLYVTIELK